MIVTLYLIVLQSNEYKYKRPLYMEHARKWTTQYAIQGAPAAVSLAHTVYQV